MSGKEGGDQEGWWAGRSDDRGRLGRTTPPSSLGVEARHREHASTTVSPCPSGTTTSVPPPLSPRPAAALLSFVCRHRHHYLPKGVKEKETLQKKLSTMRILPFFPL